MRTFASLPHGTVTTTGTGTTSNPALKPSTLARRHGPARPSARRQRGFTLVEFIVVGIIVTVVGLLGVPRIRQFIIDGRVTPTANDMIAAVTRIRANAEGTGNTPYSTVVTATLANTLRERTLAMTVTGIAAAGTVQHKLGATGAQITCAASTITTLGDSFACTFPTVNNAACPGLSTALQSNSEIITVNGTTVKSVPAGTVYSGQAAQDACTADDTNTFVFTFR